MAADISHRAKYLPMVRDLSDEYGIYHKLVGAIITVESNWEPLALRFEKDFNYLTIPQKYAKKNKTTLDTEIALQRFSYGLCQLMGGTARWLGFDGALIDLLDVETNLRWALRHLANLEKTYGESSDVIAAYNAGSPRRKASGAYVNQTYVNRVMSLL